MNRLHLIGLFLAILLGINVSSGAPVYVYTTSEGIVAFNTEDILSIDYEEATDQLSTVQKFNTPDSVYVFRISDIDSVGFKTPKPRFVPKVDMTASLSEYVVSANNLTLLLKETVPADIVPVSGQTIFISPDTTRMTLPFAGRVNTVEKISKGIQIECDPVELTEIFDTYYGVVNNDNSIEDMPARVTGQSSETGFITFRPNPINIEMARGIIDYEFDEDSPFSIGGNGSWMISIAPQLRYSGYCIITPEYGVNIGATLITDLSFTNEISVAGQVSASTDISMFSITIPVRQILMDIYFEVGVTASASAAVALNRTHEKSYRHTYRFDWSSKRKKKLNKYSDLIKTNDTHNGKFAINGSLSAGVYIELGIAFICTKSLDIAKADVRFETGLKTEGNWVPSKKESAHALLSPDYYRRVLASKISSGTYQSMAAELHLFGWSPKYDGQLFDSLNNFNPFESIGFVPEFKDIKANRENGTMASASVSAEGLTSPCEIGMAIVDKESDSIDYHYSADYIGPNDHISAEFSGLLFERDYKVMPLVKSMGVEMIADPSCDLDGIPIFGRYTCVWHTTPPNAKLLSMVLNEDYSMSQTYYYANNGETVTYHSSFSKDGNTLTFYKSNGDVQKWYIEELTEETLVISQPDGFTYHFIR